VVDDRLEQSAALAHGQQDGRLTIALVRVRVRVRVRARVRVRFRVRARARVSLTSLVSALAAAASEAGPGGAPLTVGAGAGAGASSLGSCPARYRLVGGLRPPACTATGSSGLAATGALMGLGVGVGEG